MENIFAFIRDNFEENDCLNSCLPKIFNSVIDYKRNYNNYDIIRDIKLSINNLKNKKIEYIIKNNS